MFNTKVVHKIKTHFTLKNFFPRKSCRLWDNMEKYGTARQATDDNIILRMRFAWWITKATDTHSQYVILIAFPRQQWLRERASMLRYPYIASFILYLNPGVLTVTAQSAVTGYTQYSWTPAQYTPVRVTGILLVIAAARPIQLPVHNRKLFVQRRWGTATGR
jgi:hypothetical protein